MKEMEERLIAVEKELQKLREQIVALSGISFELIIPEDSHAVTCSSKFRSM